MELQPSPYYPAGLARSSYPTWRSIAASSRSQVSTPRIGCPVQASTGSPQVSPSRVERDQGATPEEAHAIASTLGPRGRDGGGKLGRRPFRLSAAGSHFSLATPGRRAAPDGRHRAPRRAPPGAGRRGGAARVGGDRRVRLADAQPDGRHSHLHRQRRLGPHRPARRPAANEREPHQAGRRHARRRGRRSWSAPTASPR